MPGNVIFSKEKSFSSNLCLAKVQLYSTEELRKGMTDHWKISAWAGMHLSSKYNLQTPLDHYHRLGMTDYDKFTLSNVSCVSPEHFPAPGAASQEQQSLRLYCTVPRRRF